MSHVMTQASPAVPCTSPTALSYAAALRGVKPRRSGEAFAYAVFNCQAPERLVGMAASNPEGRFFGISSDPAFCAKAMEDARARGVMNVTFHSEGSLSALPQLHYLCCDESVAPLSAASRATLLDLAATRLVPGGLFAYSYRAYADGDGALRFLVREFAPEMNLQQAAEFLLELKKLGTVYFREHSVLASQLDQAIAKNMPDAFFSLFDQGEARSNGFDTMIAMGARGFSFGGDQNVTSNYIELSVPAAAQPVVLDCRTNPLYEPVKDFATNRPVRNDIWVKRPMVMTADPAQLFGSFAYGITLPRDKVPASFAAEGKTIPLDSTLYTKLIDIMALMPATIGDMLGHPDIKGQDANEVLGAVQILIACGVARPMRGNDHLGDVSNIAQPRLVGNFNRYIEKAILVGDEMLLASKVMGDVIKVSARDALVMQALDRGGLANSVAALLPELERLAKNPAQAARVMDTAEPTEDVARRMVEDSVTKSIVQWYAYGLLQAA